MSSMTNFFFTFLVYLFLYLLVYFINLLLCLFIHLLIYNSQEMCTGPTCHAEESYYGGSPFNIIDPSTHWCEPHQLFTWWKNNVERRSKFKVLQDDATYRDSDSRKIARWVRPLTCYPIVFSSAFLLFLSSLLVPPILLLSPPIFPLFSHVSRARWCEAVVALSEVIRASSGSSCATKVRRRTICESDDVWEWGCMRVGCVRGRTMYEREDLIWEWRQCMRVKIYESEDITVIERYLRVKIHHCHHHNG